MKSRSAILKLMNVKKDEGSTILLLIIFSFFLGIGVAFYYTATTSLLLVSFEREILPFAYIGGGIVVYLISLMFAQLQKRIKTSGFLISALLFLIITVIILLLLYSSTGSKWITLVLFIWMRVFAYIQGISFWGLASGIFNLGQGKRLFGLISAGEVVSHMICFFSVPFLLKYINTEDLLFLSIGGLALSALFLIILVQKYSEKLTVKRSKKKKTKQIKKKPLNLFKDKYLSLIFTLAFIPMFANFIVDFVFLTQTKELFSNKEVLSGFIGIFFGVTAIIEFIAKTFVAGRIINDHGIKVGLPSLPLLLGISTFLAVVAGLLFGPAGAFFAFIALGKLFMRAVRTSLYEPSFQILFQPVPKETRLAFQSKIEGGPKAFGNIIAGAVLLLFTSFGFVTLVHFNILLLIVVAFWLHSALKMTKEYRNTLHKLISGGVKIKKAIINDKSNINIITSGLHTSNQYLFNLLIKLLEKLEPSQKGSLLIYMMGNASSKIKKVILNIIRDKRMVKTLENLETEVQKIKSADLQQDFNETIRILREVENISFSKIEDLAKSKEVSDRVNAAVILGKSSRYKAHLYIKELSRDENSKVKEEAIIAAGYLKNYELWSIVINNLASPEFATTAYSASKLIGPRILKDLELFYNKMANNKIVQLRILKLYEEIGGEAVIKLLRSKISSPDKEIRDKALDSLSILNYSASTTEKPIIKEAIEDEISSIVCIVAASIDLEELDEDKDIIAALRYEFDSKLKKIFNLLSILYETRTIQFVREVMAEGSKESHVFALEIMDLMLSEDHKNIIMPLFDELPEEELVKKYALIFPQEMLDIESRLCDIINTDYNRICSWTRSCAIKLLQEYSSPEIERVLAANILHPDIIVRDTAQRSLLSVNPIKLNECLSTLKDKTEIFTKTIIGELQATNISQNMSIFEKVNLLSQIHFLSEVPKQIIVKLASESKTLYITDLERISIAEDFFVVILEGTVLIMDQEGETKNLKPASVIGNISPDFLRNPDIQFIANGEVTLIQICYDHLYELMINHANITEALVLNLVDKLSEKTNEKKSQNYA